MGVAQVFRENQWYHLAFVFVAFVFITVDARRQHGTTMYSYVNGELRGSLTTNTMYAGTGTNTWIGNIPWANTNFLSV